MLLCSILVTVPVRTTHKDLSDMTEAPPYMRMLRAFALEFKMCFELVLL
jgi:hypothetical protein